MSFYKQLQSMTSNEKKSKPKHVPKANFSTQQELTIDDITCEDLPLEFVKQYLRVDHELDDLEIMVATRSAQSYVRTYVKQPDDEPLDDGLLAPLLAIISHFYESKSPLMKSTEKLDVMFGTILDLYKREVL